MTVRPLRPVADLDRDADPVVDAPDLVGAEEPSEHDRSVSTPRLAAFTVLVVACALGIVAVAASIVDPRTVLTTTERGDGTSAGDQVAATRRGAHVAVRSTELGPSFGTVAVAPSGPDGWPRGATAATDLACDRVAEGADRGLCLVADRGAITSYRAVVYDLDQRTLFTFDLPGEPSRARVAPDGRHGASTVFVSGHSYAQAGFSTSTVIYDLRTGTSLGDLEQFELRRDGTVVDAIDRNFWGVTFAGDGRTFYATASTGGETFLVQGDLEDRAMTVLRDGVECPSLSPDGTRVAFKRRTTGALGQIEWRLAVLDLATGDITDTAEVRSVDDQAAWLDDRTLLYGLGRDDPASPTTDVWAVPADGRGAPERFLAGAASPTAVAAAPAEPG